MKSPQSHNKSRNQHQQQSQALYAVTLSAFLLLLIKSQSLVLYWQQSRHILLEVTPPPALSDFAPAWFSVPVEPIWSQTSRWFSRLSQAPWHTEATQVATATYDSLDENDSLDKNHSLDEQATDQLEAEDIRQFSPQTQIATLEEPHQANSLPESQADHTHALQSADNNTVLSDASAQSAINQSGAANSVAATSVATNKTVDKQSAAAATSRLINGNSNADASTSIDTVVTQSVSSTQPSVDAKSPVKTSTEVIATPAAVPSQQTATIAPTTPETPDTSATTLATLNSIDAAGQIELMPNDKVLLIGDSLMQGLAPHLIARFNKKHQITIVDMSRHSTGLTYPAFYNWPEAVTQAFAQQNFDVLVVFMGANDPWDMTIKGKYIRFGSDKWQEIYRERVRTILSTAKMQQTRVIWLGTPPMGREDLKDKIPQLNQIYQAEVAKFSENARFIDTAPVLTADGKTYSRFLELPERGSVMLRTDDGIHFTTQGHKVLSTLTLAQFRLPATKKKS